jgi:hypothetical protein
VTLRLYFKEQIQADALRVSLNKSVLKNPTPESNWLQFAVDAKALAPTNKIEIATTGKPAVVTDAMLSVRK